MNFTKFLNKETFSIIVNWFSILTITLCDLMQLNGAFSFDKMFGEIFKLLLKIWMKTTQFCNLLEQHFYADLMN